MAAQCPHPAATIEIFRIGHSQPERMRVLATRLPDGSRMLAGMSSSELRVARAMEEAMAVGMAAAIVLAALAAWIAARMIERRLEDTVATAHAVAAGELSRRVVTKGGDDAFDALAGAVNAMLDRIALLMTELKIATDGLAHDLRSPLTRLRATLERALAETQDESARVSVGRALEEGDRLLAMLDTALRISRAEAGLGRDAFVEADLAAMARRGRHVRAAGRGSRHDDPGRGARPAGGAGPPRTAGPGAGQSGRQCPEIRIGRGDGAGRVRPGPHRRR
jgi:signal transduction histidine kinase